MRIAIIGAGAAGCFAAANIPSGHEVVVFEKSGKAMQKVKVSGGGRCNVTHDCYDIPELLRRYPRGGPLLKRTLYQFGPQQTIDWFAKRGVPIKAEADGRMFPVSDSSQTIIDAIWSEMMTRGVHVQFNKGLQSAARDSDGWQLTFDRGEPHHCDKLLLAPGAIQKPAHWDWLWQLGHTMQPPAPSLFTFNLPGNPITALMGVSVPSVSLRLEGTNFHQNGPLLITHWGFSGPAALRLSAFAARWLQEQSYTCTLRVNWLNDATDADLREQISTLRQQEGKAFLGQRNPFGLPRRLWEFFLQKAEIEETIRWGELSAAASAKLRSVLVSDAYAVKGKTTYKEEFVTCGGVTTSEIHSQTMESRVVPGLYFAGEAIDVDGITGGYNFQHAWASGWVAAKAMNAADSGLKTA